MSIAPALKASIILSFIAALWIIPELGRSSFMEMDGSYRSPASVGPQKEVPKLENEAHATVSPLWPVKGERWIFRFERKVSAEFQGKSWLKLTLGGRASLEPTGEFADHRFFLIALELDRLQMVNEGVSTEKNEKRSFPFVRFDIDASGKLREMRWVSLTGEVKAPSEEDSDFVKDLVSQFLFFENRSRLGTAKSTLKVLAKTETNETLHKTVLKYENHPEFSNLESEHEWVSDTHRIQRIEGTENYSLAGATGSFDQKTSYRWVFNSSEKTESVVTDLNLGTVLKLEEDISSGKRDSERMAKRFDLKSFPTQWSALAALAPHDRLRLFGEVKNALDGGQSELVSVIVKSLDGNTSTSLEWRTGVGVLGASSNPVSAEALLNLYKNTNVEDAKLSILAAVTSGEGTPAPDWKRTLEAEVANEAGAIHDASLFALGSAIRKENDSERKKDLQTLLWSEVRNSNSDSSQLAALDAIGNSGSAEFYTYVKERFSSSNPSIRARAVSAVRFLASDLAQPIIDTARADPAVIVRKAAEWSKRFQEPATQ